MTTIFGHTFTTTNVFGYTDDGMGGEAQRAFPGCDDAAGRRRISPTAARWHLFFGWVLVALADHLHRRRRRFAGTCAS